MSLRYALLALLTVEPMTGYDLSKRFESSVAYVWHAPDSQIYPELRRMEKDGLLVGEEVPWGPRGKKTQYRITGEGAAAFREWINTALEYSRERDPVHLKAAYLEWAEPASARALMEAHIAHHTLRRKQWEGMVQELRGGTSVMLGRRLAVTPAADHERTTEYKIFTYEGLIARAETEIAWGRRGLELIDSLEDGS
ncbi:PadR family transcriptional regulator AphA [Arthrobacter sp. V4I6]|uniref:PadR family transcriptional regulator n=1 Tax=unclassified Arthrobacter TaxID=235627 RepID=UPI002781F9E9|nr:MULTISPECIES: helix-turn-helix transcriptional regulator [unclassified Arthrobacter]MDQ0821426.1 PadR family transcriptional regulator AphA [Arthrobacter sp. V1I7]MDQ0855692.1 PadR family transcriptional regulator AphA [Arthrobacter sp. V4I6]